MVHFEFVGSIVDPREEAIFEGPSTRNVVYERRDVLGVLDDVDISRCQQWSRLGTVRDYASQRSLFGSLRV